LILKPEADVELLEPDPSSSNTPLARPAIERDEDEPFVRLTDSLGGDLERPLLLLLKVGESISPSSTSPASRMLSERMGILAGRCSPFPRPIGQRLTLGATRIERASPKKSESRFQHPFLTLFLRFFLPRSDCRRTSRPSLYADSAARTVS
jgi:hypothetical protein